MIEKIWDNLLKYEGEEFFQIKGKMFTYEVNDNYLIPSTTNIKIYKSEIEKALKLCPLNNTVQINNLIAPSYLFALLTDQRIIGGINFI